MTTPRQPQAAAQARRLADQGYRLVDVDPACNSPRSLPDPFAIACPEPFCRAMPGLPCPLPTASVPAHAARILAARGDR